MFMKIIRYALYFFGSLFIIIMIFFLISSVFFRVYPNQHAVVFERGVPIRTVTMPGIDFKLPFIQNVGYCNMRTRNTQFDPFYVQTKDFTKFRVEGSLSVQIQDCTKYLTSPPPKNPLIDTLLATVYKETRNIIREYQSYDIIIKGEEISVEIVDHLMPISVNFGVQITDLNLLFEKEEGPAQQ